MPKKIIPLIALLASILYANYAYSLNLDNIKASFLSGNYRQAIADGEKMLSLKPGSSRLDELHYILGLSFLKEGNYRKAEGNFEVILKEYPNSGFKDEARLGLGDAYFLDGELKGAEEAFKELLESQPNTKLKAQLLYRLGRVSFRMGDGVSGRYYSDTLNKEFPQNIEPKIMQADNAYPSLAEGSGVYSVQVGSFSNKNNAEGLMDKLTKSGYAAYMEEAGGAYRVRVGRFSARREALELEKKLAQEGYPTKICP